MIVIEVEGSIDEKTTQALRNAVLAARILRKIYGIEAIAYSSPNLFSLTSSIELLQGSEPITIRINNKAISVDRPPDPHVIVEWALKIDEVKSSQEAGRIGAGPGSDRSMFGAVEVHSGNGIVRGPLNPLRSLSALHSI